MKFTQIQGQKPAGNLWDEEHFLLLVRPSGALSAFQKLWWPQRLINWTNLWGWKESHNCNLCPGSCLPLKSQEIFFPLSRGKIKLLKELGPKLKIKPLLSPYMLDVKYQNQWIHHQSFTFWELLCVQESHLVRWQWNHSLCSPINALTKGQLGPETEKQKWWPNTWISEPTGSICQGYAWVIQTASFQLSAVCVCMFTSWFPGVGTGEKPLTLGKGKKNLRTPKC